MSPRRIVAVLAAVALAGGCGAGAPVPSKMPAPPDTQASRSAGPFDDTDVTFLRAMIPLHRQGLEMVDVGATRARRAEVRTLAAAIASTQRDELTQLTGWLTLWGDPQAPDDAAHAAHDAAPGTSEDQIATLKTVRDTDFERHFLTMLISQQDDSVQIAKLETAKGANPDARALAGRITASRSAEIARMKALLASP